MVSGTLYTYPGSYRANQILIAAGYSGADVKIHPDFEFGKTNTSPSFLKKFPLGKVPAFEDSQGNLLTETQAITYYVSNETLRGGPDTINQALVQQYISFAENEITPSACTWTFPTLGFRQYNKQDTEKAMNHIKKCFELLNDLLLTRTFLVGERVTLADISLCCSLVTLYVQVLDPTFREPYSNVNRWFLTCINQPNFKKVYGEVTLCSKMKTFDEKRYSELHPKEQKGKGKGNKQAKQPKQETQKASNADKKPAEAEKPADAAPKPKKDYFADVPASSFVLDDWKRQYANNDDVQISYDFLWKHFDPNAYSFWYFKYKYPEDNDMDFKASNLLDGMLQRVEALRKHSHCMGATYEQTKDGKTCFGVEGVWLWRGTTLVFERNVDDWTKDSPNFEFTKLDPVNNEDDKDCVEWCYMFEGKWKGGEGREPDQFKELR